MCGRLGVSGKVVVPGTTMQFSIGKNQRMGIWGIPGLRMNLIYNARNDKLLTYWSKYWPNRGILSVDSFIEPGGHAFGYVGKPIELGLIYNEYNSFAIVTQESKGPVEKVHPRMPIIITDADLWLNEGKLGPIPAELIEQGLAEEYECV